MRLLRLQATLLLIAALALPSLFADPRETLLITAFEPFGGASQNQSMDVAQALAAKITKYQTVVCVLPVVYDRAAEAALKCFDEMEKKPSVVLSLGEGGCDVRLESRGQNWDADGADNAGVNRRGSVILPDGPAYSPLEFPLEKMMSTLQTRFGRRDRDLVRISHSAGNYVCNNTAYHLSRYFSQPGDATYGFIHVPNHACARGTRDAGRVSNILKILLEENL